MKTDAISRSALLDAMRDTEFQNWHPLDEIDAVIDAAPALDVQPVVRCKECVYRATGDCPMRHTETTLDDLDGYDKIVFDRTDDNGFCQRGARMDAEESV